MKTGNQRGKVTSATGRPSLNDPNPQNIPVRTEEGREVCRAFLPGADEKLLILADYSQIEIRIRGSVCVRQEKTPREQGEAQR